MEQFYFSCLKKFNSECFRVYVWIFFFFLQSGKNSKEKEIVSFAEHLQIKQFFSVPKVISFELGWGEYSNSKLLIPSFFCSMSTFNTKNVGSNRSHKLITVTLKVEFTHTICTFIWNKIQQSRKKRHLSIYLLISMRNWKPYL